MHVLHIFRWIMPQKSRKNAKTPTDDEKRAPNLTLASYLFPAPSSSDNSVSTCSSSTETSTSSECKVKRTKKGNAPVTVESAFGGRKVTIVSNVSGDASSLLKELKVKLGTGGELTDGKIEIQGDHATRVAAFLKEKKYLCS